MRSARERERSATPAVPIDYKQLFAALTAHLPFGIGIWDRSLRFRFINNALASINGYPAQDHLGKPLHKMIGPIADQVAPAHEHVFATGEIFNQVHSEGLLPTRTEVGHWVETVFPLRDKFGKIAYVSGIIIEVTPLISLQKSMEHVAGALHHANSEPTPSPLPVAQNLDQVLRRSVSRLRALSDSFTPTLLANIAASLNTPLSQFTNPADTELSILPAVPRTDTSVPLSAREQQVLRLLALGKTNKEIAASFKLSIRTVETYRARLMLKLGLQSVAQLVRYAIRNHVI